LRAGKLCPVELTESYLAAIEAHPSGTRIYARTTDRRALTEAMAARSRARAGLRRGPLDGVALSWKDLFDSAGVATEAGSALLKGRVPDRDAARAASGDPSGHDLSGQDAYDRTGVFGAGVEPCHGDAPVCE
jgi:aspartyl-tRNA(Asn)/glutamyl-tRNA(Gln) amidotransferase subunit A